MTFNDVDIYWEQIHAQTSVVALGTCESAVLISWNQKRNLTRIRIILIFSWEALHSALGRFLGFCMWVMVCMLR